MELMLGKNVDAPPPYFENDLWQNDEEFGRQMLNGMNPSWIERVKGDLPENFPVTNDIVGEYLYQTLEEEIEEGRIYLINHELNYSSIHSSQMSILYRILNEYVLL